MSLYPSHVSYTKHISRGSNNKTAIASGQPGMGDIYDAMPNNPWPPWTRLLLPHSVCLSKSLSFLPSHLACYHLPPLPPFHFLLPSLRERTARLAGNEQHQDQNRSSDEMGHHPPFFLSPCSPVLHKTSSSIFLSPPYLTPQVVQLACACLLDGVKYVHTRIKAEHSPPFLVGNGNKQQKNNPRNHSALSWDHGTTIGNNYEDWNKKGAPLIQDKTSKPLIPLQLHFSPLIPPLFLLQ